MAVYAHIISEQIEGQGLRAAVIVRYNACHPVRL
jgi:hypothetical protein